MVSVILTLIPLRTSNELAQKGLRFMDAMVVAKVRFRLHERHQEWFGGMD